MYNRWLVHLDKILPLSEEFICSDLQIFGITWNNRTQNYFNFINLLGLYFFCITFLRHETVNVLVMVALIWQFFYVPKIEQRNQQSMNPPFDQDYDLIEVVKHRTDFDYQWGPTGQNQLKQRFIYDDYKR